MQGELTKAILSYGIATTVIKLLIDSLGFIIGNHFTTPDLIKSECNTCFH